MWICVGGVEEGRFGVGKDFPARNRVVQIATRAPDTPIAVPTSSSLVTLGNYYLYKGTVVVYTRAKRYGRILEYACKCNG